MQLSKWGILCPGPSLALHNTQQEISAAGLNVLVAVNGAILLADFQFDYWAMQDIEVFETIIQKIDISTLYNTRLWIPRRWLSDIPANYNILNFHFQAFYKETFPAESNEAFNQIVPFGHQINWRESTVFTAIALAIISGAKEIHIYGADMSGQGYFIKGIENYRTRHNEKRWLAERQTFFDLAQECKKYGVTIIHERQIA